VLCSIAGTTAPQETAKYLAEPLLAAVEAELPSLKKATAAPGGMNISKVEFRCAHRANVFAHGINEATSAECCQISITAFLYLYPTRTPSPILPTNKQ